MSQCTIVLLSQQEMFDRIAKILENAKAEFLAFLSSYTLILTTDMEMFQTRKLAARKRGVRLRYITEVTKDNLPYCKRQIGMVDELRHLDGIRGNFIVSDTEFMASANISKEKPITEGVYSNMSQVIKLERYVFETLWNYAVPAELRIKQLESVRQSAIPRLQSSIIEKGKQTGVIDRLYVCAECRSVFIYRDELQEHQRTTGHDKTREFPILD